MTHEETVVALRAMRNQRNMLLRNSVDTINSIRWETWSQEKKDAWKIYLQALFDVPAEIGFPQIIDWPTKPR